MYSHSFSRLRNILTELRLRCPWDKKQTLQSLSPQTTEELYELTDAIARNDWGNIKEELGDLLLHIVFYARIAEEASAFSLDDVIENICNKLVQRHPHIYGSVNAEDEEAVKRNWEKIKAETRQASLLSGVPTAMPALPKALRLQEKTASVGFEWDDIKDVRDKVFEEIAELDAALALKDQDAAAAEMGDVFFALINYARFAKVDPEQALERTNKKFIRRFQFIEEQAAQSGKSLHDMTLREMDELWNQAKKSE